MDIVIRNLYKHFDDKVVIDNFSHTFKANTTTCIMGESGIGKTTLFNILIGELSHDSGFVTDITHKKLSVVFQEDRLFENLTISSNLNFVLDEKLDKQTLNTYLDKINLSSKLFEKVDKLSGGMKRRVSLLRAIIYSGYIYLLDEPFKGLDSKNKESTISFFNEMTEGKTKIIITHDLETVSLLNANLLTI